MDNVTRKLMQDRKRPVSVSLLFSLGHSTVVVLATVGIATVAFALADQQHADHQLRIDWGTHDQAVVGRHDLADERRVQQRVHHMEQVACGKMVIVPNRGEHRFRHDPFAHHHCLHRTMEIDESQPLDAS